MKIIIISLLLLSACSAKENIVQRTDKDLIRTSEMAVAYNKPEVKVCVDYLRAALDSENLSNDQFNGLVNEKTEGILSLALKTALIRDYVRGLQDPAKLKTFESGFNQACAKVAGQLMMNLMRDAAQDAKKIR